MSFNSDGNNSYIVLQNDGNELYVSINNIQEYQDLVALAQKQLNDLNETLHKLAHYDVKIKITF